METINLHTVFTLADDLTKKINDDVNSNKPLEDDVLFDFVNVWKPFAKCKLLDVWNIFDILDATKSLLAYTNMIREAKNLLQQDKPQEEMLPIIMNYTAGEGGQELRAAKDKACQAINDIDDMMDELYTVIAKIDDASEERREKNNGN